MNEEKIRGYAVMLCYRGIKLLSLSPCVCVSVSSCVHHPLTPTHHEFSRLPDASNLDSSHDTDAIPNTLANANG